jgi:hypothetical protein
MFACITVWLLLAPSSSLALPPLLRFQITTHICLPIFHHAPPSICRLPHPNNHQSRGKENSHAPIQTTNRNLSTIVITRQRNLRSPNQSQKSHYPNPDPPSAIWTHGASSLFSFLPFVANVFVYYERMLCLPRGAQLNCADVEVLEVSECVEVEARYFLSFFPSRIGIRSNLATRLRLSLVLDTPVKFG